MPKTSKLAKEAEVSTGVSSDNEVITKKPSKAKAKDKGTVTKEPEAITVVESAEQKTTKEKAKKPVAAKGKKTESTSLSDGAGDAAVKSPEAQNQTLPGDTGANISEGNQSSTEEKKMDTKPKQQVRYSDEDLEMFRERILDVRKEAIEELSMLKDRLEDLTNYDVAEESMIYSMHMAEQGSEFIEKEKTYAQIQRINEYIKKLDEAIQRINEKTFGICRVCGCLIAKERLLAVPITTLSASYKIHKKCPEDGIDRIEPLK